MKFKSQLLQQASGSVGGATYSRNKGGMYIRQRGLVKNPNTAEQQAVRANLTAMAQLWASPTGGVDRDGWSVYAKNVPLLNALGDSRPIPGLAMFSKCNTPRVQFGDDIVFAGPTLYTLASYTAPTIAFTAPSTLTLTFTASDEWAQEDGGAMYVWASRPQNAGINFFKGPFQAAGSVEGSLMTPPTSPKTITLPFPGVVGNKFFIRVNVTRADGRPGTALIIAGTM